jgi:hypothetical protein
MRRTPPGESTRYPGCLRTRFSHLRPHFPSRALGPCLPFVTGAADSNCALASALAQGDGRDRPVGEKRHSTLRTRLTHDASALL